MPGHEFEKNVQQRLDELKLRPSDAVWNNVEYSIRKDKRRRRMILWLPILLMFLGTSGYFLINKNGFISAETAVKKNQNNKNNTVSSTPESKQENNTANIKAQESQKDKNLELVTESPNNNTISDKSITKNNSTKNSISNNKQSSILYKNNSSKRESILVNNENKAEVLNKDAQSFNPKETGGVLPVSIDADPIKYSNADFSLIKSTTPFVSLTVPEKTNATLETPIVDMNNLSKSNQKNIYRSSKWQWGLDLSVGTSAAASEVSFLKSAAMDNGGSVGVGGGNPQASDHASTIDPGMHWSAGGFVQRNFTNSFSLSAGLQYSQFTTKIITGARVDSTRIFYNGSNFAVVNNYYRNGKANEYVNRYHFLELPVDVHFKLNKSNNFPLYANAGLSMAWLLGTNSLNYDGSTGSYYQDGDLYNKTQIGFHGGLIFGVLNKTKHPMQIGPSMRYNFSRLLENSSSNKHLVSFGIDFRLLLKK